MENHHSITAVDICNMLNNVLSQIEQMKTEMRANMCDILTQINQLKVENRGNHTDTASGMNQVRAEIKSCTGEVRSCSSQLTAVRQENGASYLHTKDQQPNIIDETSRQGIRKLRESTRRQSELNSLLGDALTGNTIGVSPRQHSSPGIRQGYAVKPPGYSTSIPMFHQQRPSRSVSPNRITSNLDEEDDEYRNEVMVLSDEPTTNGGSHYPGLSKRPSSSQAPIYSPAKRLQTDTSYSEVTIDQSGDTNYVQAEDNMEMVEIGPHLQISRIDYETFQDDPRTVYLRKLLDVVFGKEMLATHTVGGRSDRPPLDQEVTNDIIMHIVQKFSVDEMCVKKYISDRCYSEFKKKSMEQ